jgi:hypothetical protein
MSDERSAYQPASRGALISPAQAGKLGDQCRQLHHSVGHDLYI